MKDSKDAIAQINKASIDASKVVALTEGSCHKCGKQTDTFCDICNSWVCNEHMVEGKDECLCLECKGK